MSAPALEVYKDRVTTVTVDLGMDITGDTLTSQIRERQDKSSALIGSWDIAVDDAESGLITMTFDDSPGTVTKTEGWMDIKRVIGSEAYPVWDDPLRVKFVGAVTD